MPTAANNITLETDLNQSPWFDDFDEFKGFYRILFKPSVAVQSRELLQLQTMLQNQIDRFASHVFKEGTRVKGGEFNYDQKLYYVKINDLNAFSNTVSVTNFDNTLLTGNTSGVKAYVVDVADGTEVASNTKTLFVKYSDAGSNNDALMFAPGENITSNTAFSATVIANTNAVGLGSSFDIGEGVIYARDHFIYHPAQRIILDRYSPYPSYRVGFLINEEIVDYLDDSTLLDPASGAYNFAAPGADRLKLSATLTKYGLNEIVPPGFVELISIKAGVVQDIAERTEYADIRNELARRTYDESGDYVVRGWNVRVRENLDDGENGGVYTEENGGNSMLLAAGVEPGLGYVHGYDYETLVTKYVDVDKGIDYKDIEGVSVAANYGSYLLVNENVGYWDIENSKTVSLLDTAEQRISTIEGSSTSPTGNTIGTAKVRAIVHEEGIAGEANTTYRLYLYDIQMTDADFASVRSVYLDNASGTDACADAVLTDSNTAVLNESAFRSLLFPVTASYLRRVRDSANNVEMQFQFYKVFSATIDTNGQATLTSDADEVFPYSTGLLNNTQKNDGFYVTLNSAVDTADLTGTVTISNSNGTVTGSGTAFTTQFHIDDYIKVGSDVRRILSIASNTSLTVDSAFSGSSGGNSFKKRYLAGHVIDYTQKGSSGTDRTINITSSITADLDMKETLGSSVTAKIITNLRKVDGREKKKVLNSGRYVRINCNTHPTVNQGPYCVGLADVFRLVSVRKNTSAFTSASQGTDVTSSFLLDNGQRDGHYDMARILPTASAGLTGTDHLLIEVDYFDHDATLGDGYMTVDSYPIDDTNAANTTAIETKEIPLYRSPTSGYVYNLRDCIDCRPRMTDTATDTTTVSSATTNPGYATAFDTTTNGIMTPVVNEDFNFDLSYYLPRKDLIIMDAQGLIRVIRGVPNKFPITPSTPGDSMALAVLAIPPYPSIPPNAGSQIGRPDLAVIIKNVANRRYTMRDIGVLDKRISSLEYYSALSLLEKQTSDMIIPDDNGLDRFKNGILVDPFMGHKIGNVYSPDYHCSIDPTAKEMRPEADVNNINMEYSSSSTNIYRAPTDAVITLTTDSANSYTVGEDIYQGSSLGTASARGILRFGVNDKLYVEQVQGTFVTSVSTKGDDSEIESATSEVVTPRPGSLATLPYTHAVYASQPYATTTRNAAGLFYNWVGYLELVPNIDTWTDTTVLPDVTVNFDGNLDAWQTIAAAWGTEWNSWQTRWTGTEVIGESEVVTGTHSDTVRTTNVVGVTPISWQEGGSIGGQEITQTFDTTTTYQDYIQNQTVQTTSDLFRTGQALTVTPETSTQRLGSRVVDVTIKPYMRPRRVLVRAQGLKGNARLYAFFDGEDVSQYMIPISASGWNYFSTWHAVVNAAGNSQGPIVLSDLTTFTTPVPYDQSNPYTTGQVVISDPTFYDSSWVGDLGDDLVTDSEGKIVCFFDIPESHFAVGTKTFRLSDSPTNSSVLGQVTTSATSQYTSQGLGAQTQDTIVSTQNAKVEFGTVEEQQTVTSTATTTTRGSRVIGVTEVEVPPPPPNYDPIGQSVLIRITDTTVPGIFVTKVDLYFSTKHAYLPVIIQLREMETTGSISNKIVPYSEVVVYPADINISDDGTAPTPITFTAPIYLQSGVEYALVVKPAAGNPDYALFTAQLGQADLKTGERVSTQPYAGVLFASANDRTWSAVQDEDLKFTLYRAVFDTGVTGTLVMQNQRGEFLTIANTTGSWTSVNEQVRGDITLVANTVTGSANVGEFLWGSTSNAYGEIISANSSTFVLEEQEAGRTFVSGETLVFKFANTVNTGASANLQLLTCPVGFVDYYLEGVQNTSLFLKNVSTSAFSSGQKIRGETSNTVAFVQGNVGIKMNVIQPQVGQLVFTPTTLTWDIKASSSTTKTLASTWTSTVVNENFTFDSEMVVLSASDEDTFNSGNRSLQLRGTLKTTSDYVSPVVDLTVSGAIVVKNLINNDATGEDGARGGNALARYITRKVTLAEDLDAEDLKVFVTAYQPNVTTVKVYAKILHGEDSGVFDDQNWIEMVRTVATSYSDTENKNDFREAEFNMPDSVKTGENGEVQYESASSGVTFTGYKYFAIKIVLLSSNTAVIPRVKDLRAIALQL